MKKLIYVVMATGLCLASVNASAATAATSKNTKTTKTAAKKTTPAAPVQKAPVAVSMSDVAKNFQTKTLDYKEKQAVEYYTKAVDAYYVNHEPNTAMRHLDASVKALGRVTPRVAYLQAKISYEAADYETTRNACAAYFSSNPIKDEGYAEMQTLSEQMKAYFMQQADIKEEAERLKQAEAAKQLADKKAATAKAEAEIEEARKVREERRKQMSGFRKQAEADLDVARKANSREAYEKFIQKYPFGSARVTATNEMNQKFPYPTRTLKKGKYGYTNKAGKFVVKAEFDNAADFQEGLAKVGKGGKYGYVNEAGKLVIPVQYKSATDFSYGMAAVKDQNGNAFFIDKQGKKVANKNYKDVRPYYNGLAAVANDKRQYGYIDTTGKEVIAPQFDVVNNFSGRYAVVAKKENGKLKYGYVKKDGTLLSGLEYDEAKDFQFGIARVKKDGKYGLIDYNGKLVTLCVYDYITDFNKEGYATARRGGMDVLLNRDGEPFSKVNGNLIPVKFKN